LKDEDGTPVASKMKIKLSLVSEPEDNFETFMANVKADVSRLDNTIAPPSILAPLGGVLLLTKNIMDNVSDVCHWYSSPICRRSDSWLHE
jgi:hypothetical protein